MGIKRSENTFEGESQIYNIGSPSSEEIPDYQLLDEKTKILPKYTNPGQKEPA